MYAVIKLDIRNRSMAAVHAGNRQCCFDTLEEAVKELEFLMKMHNGAYLKNVPYVILPSSDPVVEQAIEAGWQARDSAYPVWIRF